MKYLNIPTAIRQHEELMRSGPKQVGIWFLLLAWCHEQMNNGMISSCQDWPDHLWAKVANCTAKEIAEPSHLWHFSGMVLVVHHYDSRAEEAYRRRQRLGREYAERQWEQVRQKKTERLANRSQKKVVHLHQKNGNSSL